MVEESLCKPVPKRKELLNELRKRQCKHRHIRDEDIVELALTPLLSPIRETLSAGSEGYSIRMDIKTHTLSKLH